MRTFRPSVYPNSPSPCLNASASASLVGVTPRTAIRGVLPADCASLASGVARRARTKLAMARNRGVLTAPQLKRRMRNSITPSSSSPQPGRSRPAGCFMQDRHPWTDWKQRVPADEMRVPAGRGDTGPIVRKIPETQFPPIEVLNEAKVERTLLDSVYWIIQY